MKLYGYTSILLSAMLTAVACTNVTPVDVDDLAQAELLDKRDKLKWQEEKDTHAKNQEDSAAIAEANGVAREKYLEALRAYKKTEHPLMFGWFYNWNPGTPDKEFSLSELPDSVDWVSNWGASFNLNQAMKDQLADAHNRGIRMTIGWIIENVGQGVPNFQEQGIEMYRDPDGSINVNKAIDAYVIALCDSIRKYDYDGIDIDYEPSFQSPFKQGKHCGDWNSTDLVDHIALISCDQYGNKDRENYFFKRLRASLDEMESEMGKSLMFNINGSLSYIDEEVAPLFDYFVAQSYHSTHQSWSTSLDRFASLGIKPEKQLILTETFENNDPNADGFDEYAAFIMNGGGAPKAAGIGAYHINADKRWGPDYANVRRVIQTLNPAMIAE